MLLLVCMRVRVESSGECGRTCCRMRGERTSRWERRDPLWYSELVQRLYRAFTELMINSLKGRVEHCHEACAWGMCYIPPFFWCLSKDFSISCILVNVWFRIQWSVCCWNHVLYQMMVAGWLSAFTSFDSRVAIVVESFVDIWWLTKRVRTPMGPFLSQLKNVSYVQRMSRHWSLVQEISRIVCSRDDLLA